MKRLPAWFTVPLTAFLLSRLLVFAAGVLGDVMLPTEEGHWVAHADSPFLSMWAKWDSQYYVDIAANGYWFRPAQQSNVAFFPLYPLTMQAAAMVLGGDLILSGFLVSNLALLGGLIFLYLLTELELGPDSAARAVSYLAFFPTSFFFSSVYTESLFVFLTIAGMYFARRHQWIPAAAFGLLAAATRNLGILMWPLVLWEWLRAQGWTIAALHKQTAWLGLWEGFKHRWFEVVVISLIPLGMLAYILFLNYNFDRPLAFIETQAAWGRENVGPLEVLRRNVAGLLEGGLNKGWLTRLWNVSSYLFFLALVPFIGLRLGEGYAVYVLLMLVVPSASSMGSIIRYLLTQFPAFMLLGWWGRDARIHRALAYSFALLLGVFVVIFVNWVFVA